MKRKGTSIIFFAFMAVFIVAGALVSNFMFNEYVKSLEREAEEGSREQFQTFAMREEILNADCITRQRGVFNKQRILPADEGGDAPDSLSCIAPPEEPITVAFSWRTREGDGWSTTVRAYRIEPREPGDPSNVGRHWEGMTFDDIWDRLTTRQPYPIVFYDGETGEYQQGILTFSR